MLREFFMENWLETHRTSARFNLGESGHAPRTVAELVTLSGLDTRTASDLFLSMPLHDSPNWGRRDLRQLIANLCPGAAVENVLVTTGTSEALFLLFRYLQPKKLALIVPAFQLLYEIPESLGAEIIPLKLEWNDTGHPLIPWETWLQTLRKQHPDTVVINHPHNPSGVTLTEAQLDALHNVCDEIGARIVGDEHYRFLTSKSPLGPTLYRNKPNTFVTGSFVKCTGTPGLRIGWCLGPNDALAKVQSEKNYTTHTVNPLSEWLATVVLNNLNSPLWQQLRQEWKQNVQTVEEFLKQPRFLGCAPQGGLVCMIAHRDWKDQKTFEKTCQQMLTSGLFMLPLQSMECERWYKPETYTPMKKSWGFRMGLGCKPQQLAQALSLLKTTMSP